MFTNKEVFNGSNYYSITPDGKLKALVSCQTPNIKFEVDLDTGELYQKYLDEKPDKDVFVIDDDDLIVESENKI